MSEMQTAVINKDSVYVGMRPVTDELPDGHSRIASITTCDLPVGEYVWIENEGNPFGGFFWPIKKKPNRKGAR